MPAKIYLQQVLLSFHLVCLLSGDVSGGTVQLEVTLGEPSVVLKYPNYPKYLAKGTEVIWAVRGPRDRHLELNCSRIELPKRNNCSEGVLSIQDSVGRVSICTVTKDYSRLFIGNEISVAFKAGHRETGRINCLVVLGPNVTVMDIGQDQQRTSCPCGQYNRKRIVEGQGTRPEDYPFMAYIKKSGSVICGGSILTQSHILTAAHCIYSSEPGKLKMVVGNHDVRRVDEVAQTLFVQQIFVHENFSTDSGMSDIGLLLLSQDIQFTPNVGPICLPRVHYQLTGHSVITLGWGRLRLTSEMSPTLRSLTMQVLDNDKEMSLDNQTQLCTVADSGSACVGDSGGPVVYLDPQLKTYVQVGVLSYGSDCKPGQQAVSTLVYGFFDWIQTKIDETVPREQTCDQLELLL